MSSNAIFVQRKILGVIVLISLLLSTGLVYGFVWLPSHVRYELPVYVEYYYQPYVPREGQRVVCIVFDDGWLSQYTNAVPILDKYDFKATFSIITRCADGLSAYMDWNKIATLHNQGHDIESHTVNHFDLTVMDTASIEYELAQSKQKFSERGIHTPLFIYPFGRGTGILDIEDLVSQHYYAAFGTKDRVVNMNDFSPYSMQRYVIEESTTLEMFRSCVDQANGATIVILCYHQIGDRSTFTSVTTEDFAAQMQYLYDNDFSVKTLKQLFTSVA
jgi:hypothetical protein